MEGRNNLFWKVLFSLLIMAVYGSCSAAYAAEFGGFEVSTGIGEYEGTGEEWEDEPVCNTPEQNDSNTYVDDLHKPMHRLFVANVQFLHVSEKISMLSVFFRQHSHFIAKLTVGTGYQNIHLIKLHLYIECYDEQYFPP